MSLYEKILPIFMANEIDKLISNLPNSPLITKAIEIAKKKHNGKKRRIENAPYLIHPLRVAHILYQAGASNELIAAAIVHDVLEDENDEEHNNNVAKSTLGYELTPEIADIVWALSDDKTIKDRSLRKQDSFDRLKEAPEKALFIKCADMIENTNDLVRMLEQGKVIPWSVFHFSPTEKLKRWKEHLELIEKKYPECTLLKKLRYNIALLSKDINQE